MQMSKNNKQNMSVMLGAAFLMATSAIGPGFLTQTATFTSSLGPSFGFVVLISLIMAAIAQMNIWRVLCYTGKRGQDVANEVKSMQAAGRQLEDIQLLEEHMDMRSMDPKLKEVMELRRENPEATLNELAELFLQKTGSPVSKSGLKHRFVRIHELAEKIRQVEHNEQQ